MQPKLKKKKKKKKKKKNIIDIFSLYIFFQYSVRKRLLSERRLN